ncbi:hypothetical protein NL449_29340, partial [Klebsiella pneumoniae]|nr:hypothetical protein [Klebsiella pneumoniae]
LATSAVDPLRAAAEPPLAPEERLLDAVLAAVPEPGAQADVVRATQAERVRALAAFVRMLIWRHRLSMQAGSGRARVDP